MWCGLFACLHLSWALGGSIGLASSAGPDLAQRRRTSLIIFGLFGTALLLLIGIAVIAVAYSPRAPRRWRHAAVLLLGVVGIGLAIRGAVLEVLLATNAAGLRASMGLWRPTGASSSGTRASPSEAQPSS